jgi:hypothetical protein
MLEASPVPNPYEFREPEPLEPNHEVAVSKLSADLFRDYYQSFRLAQNELAVQPPLFDLLAKQHAAAGHQPLMAEALQLADGQIDRLMPPAHHVETDEAGRNEKESGFRAVWNTYSDVLLGRAPYNHYRPAEGILADMLTQDINYQDEPRPNRKGNQDPHESILREYVLGDKLNGSEQLLVVRDQLRSTLLSPQHEYYGPDVTDLLRELASAWETNHPGQEFIPGHDYGVDEF